MARLLRIVVITATLLCLTTAFRHSVISQTSVSLSRRRQLISSQKSQPLLSRRPLQSINSQLNAMDSTELLPFMRKTSVGLVERTKRFFRMIYELVTVVPRFLAFLYKRATERNRVRGGQFIKESPNAFDPLAAFQNNLFSDKDMDFGLNSLFDSNSDTMKKTHQYVEQLIKDLEESKNKHIQESMSRLQGTHSSTANKIAPSTTSPSHSPSHKKKTIADLSDAELMGKRVLVRCDFNVPLSESQEILDDTRIRASLPSIQYLIKKGAKVMLLSHMGRPSNGYDAKLSLSPVATRLTALLGKSVPLVPDCRGISVAKSSQEMHNGDVILLENTRFYTEQENQNDADFVKELSANADVFVNDAFGAAHRSHASTVGLAKALPIAVAGFLLEKEMKYLQELVTSPKKPFAAIIGGAKISSKMAVIETLLQQVDRLVIGGGMVFTFLKARGINVGKSLVEDDQLEFARRMDQLAKDKGVKLVLADDVEVADVYAANANHRLVDINAIPDDMMALDIGPKTIASIRETLANCQTVLWNGPLGVAQFDAFAKGTNAVAELLADMTINKGCTTIVGGGESVAALKKVGVADKMTHISTGGGSCLQMLEGKTLPAIECLNNV